MADPVTINVVIATHGPPRRLLSTLESLAQADRPDGFERVWVIENGSDAGARQICQRIGDTIPVAYHHLPEPGKNGANEYALEQIGRGLAIFTDDDVRVNREIFTTYARAAAEHGDTGVYGGPLLIDCDQPPLDWLVPFLPKSVVGWSLDDPDTPITEPCFLGANYGAFVERFRRVGGFNLSLGPGSRGNGLQDEVDMQARLLADGCRAVYLPDAKVWHHVPAENCTPAWTLHRVYRVWFSNGLLEEQQHPGPRWKGAPRWMWRRALKLGLRSYFARLIRDPKRRFEIQRDYYQWRGYMAGLQQKHAQENQAANS